MDLFTSTLVIVASTIGRRRRLVGPVRVILNACSDEKMNETRGFEIGGVVANDCKYRIPRQVDFGKNASLQGRHGATRKISPEYTRKMEYHAGEEARRPAARGNRHKQRPLDAFAER
ncbi:hypothetical protein HDF16_005252 [Granulicella aggregans]|uniref:Uncharacterized protein n=1 Tax=Granulicella aggregans TaxID=474949 RepID=A0A7W7ZIK6_9BACT|nr:hypothetical protein [Granulicella aggregans]